MPKKLGIGFQRTLGDGPSSAAYSSSVGSTQVIKRRYETPEWFADQKKVAEFIRARFPLANKADHCGRCRACRQTMMAGKWVTVIQNWFLAHWNDTKVEETYEWKSGECGSIVQKIRRAIAGKRLDGIARTGRPRGRPKQVKLSAIVS